MGYLLGRVGAGDAFRACLAPALYRTAGSVQLVFWIGLCCAYAHAQLPTGEVGVASRAARGRGITRPAQARRFFKGAEGRGHPLGGEASPLRGARDGVLTLPWFDVHQITV